MAAYALESWSETGSHDAVVAAMETQLETVDDTKTIRMAQVTKNGNEFAGFLLYDT